MFKWMSSLACLPVAEVQLHEDGIGLKAAVTECELMYSIPVRTVLAESASQQQATGQLRIE